MALANAVTGLECGNAAERQTDTNSPGCGLNAPRNADTLKVRFGSWFPQKTQLPGKRVLRKLVYPLKPTPENVGFFVSGHYLTPFRPSLEDPGSKYPFTVSAFGNFASFFFVEVQTLIRPRVSAGGNKRELREGWNHYQGIKR